MTLAVLIFIIPGIVTLLTLAGTKVTGSDHYYHTLLIDSIKANNNRFIVKLDNFMANNYAFYPQLLHWLLSFISTPNALAIGKYTPVIFHLLSGLALYGFAIEVFPYIPNVHDLLFEEFLLYVGIIYVTIPYHYDMENAKNLNISARGIGLFLGQVFNYSIILYCLSEQLPILLIAIFASTLIYMSSQFAIQYILFSTPLLALFFTNPILLLIPILGVLPFFILMPKVASLSFKGQLNHKRIYVKYLAKKYILEIRYSIWRDFVYDFWKLLFSSKSEFSTTKKLGYILTNSLIIVLFSMPFVVPFAFDASINYFSLGTIESSGTMYKISIPIVVSVLLFIATSFRATRFLGEPERYIEFSLGLLAIAIILLYNFSYITMIIVGFSIGLTLVRYYLYITRVLKRRNEKFSNTLENIKDHLLAISAKNEIRLLCNSTFACKTFFHPKINLFWVTLVSESTGSFNFSDIFRDSYNFIHEDMIAPIALEFKINYLVIDSASTQDIDTILSSKGVHVNLIKNYEAYNLYEVV